MTIQGRAGMAGRGGRAGTLSGRDSTTAGREVSGVKYHTYFSFFFYKLVELIGEWLVINGAYHI